MTQNKDTHRQVEPALAEHIEAQLQRWLLEFPIFSQTVAREVARPAVPADLFDLENPQNEAVFRHITPLYPEQAQRVLDRSEHSAIVLKATSEGTNLADPEQGLGIREALAVLEWLCSIQPSQEHYTYQDFDLTIFSLPEQLRNVRNRLLPHSLAAGLVSYHLACQVNEIMNYQVIDPYHVLIQNLMHESQRLVTHDIILHDDLLLKVLLAALGHTDFAQDHGKAHPRILDFEAEQLSREQLVQFILWMGDAFTKASPHEGKPFATADGKPHFRKADRGVAEVLGSLKNYNASLEGEPASTDYWKILAQAFNSNPERMLQYFIDIQMLRTVPQELERLGVSLQKALDAVEPVWARVLEQFFDDGSSEGAEPATQKQPLTTEEMTVVMQRELLGFLQEHPLAQRQ